MKNKFKIEGLWIPYQILTDKNLRDKEKIIYSLILFFSNNKCYCSIRNILNRSIKRISSIINTLQDKKYILIVSKNKNEERKLYPLVRINEPIQKVPFKGLFIPLNVLLGNNINDKVLKSKNNNYKKYNNIRNYEGRNYSLEDFES